MTQQEVDAVCEENIYLLAKLNRLEEAIRPFAKEAACLETYDGHQNGGELVFGVTVDNFRNAEAAYLLAFGDIK